MKGSGAKEMTLGKTHWLASACGVCVGLTAASAVAQAPQAAAPPAAQTNMPPGDALRRGVEAYRTGDYAAAKEQLAQARLGAATLGGNELRLLADYETRAAVAAQELPPARPNGNAAMTRVEAKELMASARVLAKAGRWDDAERAARQATQYHGSTFLMDSPEKLLGEIVGMKARQPKPTMPLSPKATAPMVAAKPLDPSAMPAMPALDAVAKRPAPIVNFDPPAPPGLPMPTGDAALAEKAKAVAKIREARPALAQLAAHAILVFAARFAFLGVRRFSERDLQLHFLLFAQ